MFLLNDSSTSTIIELEDPNSTMHMAPLSLIPQYLDPLITRFAAEFESPELEGSLSGVLSAESMACGDVWAPTVTHVLGLC